MADFSLTALAGAFRRSLLEGVSMEDMLNLREQQAFLLAKIKGLTVFRHKADMFALSFLKQVDPMERRYLKTGKRYQDTFPWKKTVDGFLDDLSVASDRAHMLQTADELRDVLPLWFQAPPQTLRIGKINTGYIAALNSILTDQCQTRLLDNMDALRECQTATHHFSYRVQSYVWRSHVIGTKKKYQLDIALSQLPVDATRVMVSHMIAGKSLRTFLHHPDVVRFNQKISTFKAQRESGRGIYFNLSTLMTEVQREFLPEMTEMPGIKWGDAYSVRRIGAFRPSRNLITLSPVLDLREIPEEMITFIIYHELLHKQLGSVHINGRDYSHTPVFRKLEARFPNAAGIDHEINRLFSNPRTVLSL